MAVECTSDLVISMAEDDKMCIWGRRLGMLLHICVLVRCLFITMLFTADCIAIKFDQILGALSHMFLKILFRCLIILVITSTFLRF